MHQSANLLSPAATPTRPYDHGAGRGRPDGATAPPPFKLGYGALAFLLLAANLRPALTSVGPLLDAIRTSLGLSGVAAGLLATLPLLVFAGFAALARLGDVLGIERMLAACLILTASGILVRSAGSTVALFAGTAILATGIGVANVLVPSLIKRDYPHQVGAMTTAYVMVMSLAGAAATGLATPLAHHLAGGWRSSLAIWAAFAVLALVCWLPQARNRHEPPTASRPEDGADAQPVWRSLLAWQVTLFMGLQFLIYYVTIGWMPLYLADHGDTPAQAGWLLTLYQVLAFGAGFVAPALLRRGRDRRALAVLASLVTTLAMLGMLLAPELAAPWLAILGLSFGVTFILAFALVGMRARDHRRAATLSTMSQATAYLIAATGPVAFGWLHDLGRGWIVPMLCLIAVTIVQAAVGFGAGRAGQI